MSQTALPAIDHLKSGDIITPMECASIFCQKMRVSISTYYRTYHPFIQFKYHRQGLADNGKQIKGVGRIPYDVVIGLIHAMMGEIKDGDPSLEVLNEYMVPEKQISIKYQ